MVVAAASAGNLRITPHGFGFQTSALNYTAPYTRANGFTMGLPVGGAIDVVASNTVNVVIDVVGYTALPGGWRIFSAYPFAPGGSIAYWGFPWAMETSIPGGRLAVYTANGDNGPDSCAPNTSNNITTIRTLNNVATTYRTSAGGAANKLLFAAGQRLFTDASGGRHDGALYFDQQVQDGCSQTCYTNGKFVAYTDDGITFTQPRQLLDFCDLYTPCHSNWFCDNGFECAPDTQDGRSYYTSGAVIPSVYVNGAFYAITWTFTYNRSTKQVTNPQIWSLQSLDGNVWTLYSQISGASLQPQALQPACFLGPHLANPDMARDPATDTYYITRSYSDNFAGCPAPFGSDQKGSLFPDRIQLYKAQGAAAVIAGQWSKVLDAGCGELGFMPDSAEIAHDGLGNILPFGSGGLTLYVGVSGGGATLPSCDPSSPNSFPGSCGAAPTQRIEVVVVTP